jgi:hypothetical protein
VAADGSIIPRHGSFQADMLWKLFVYVGGIVEASLFLYLALSCMLTHEMDAIRCREWKFFLFLKDLPEEHGYLVFTALHVPLYLLLLWGMFANPAIGQYVSMGFDLFSMVHVGLHMLFRKHPNYLFHSWFSWALILGSGVAGAIDLLIRLFLNR